jgi:hypothetical protein
MSNNNEIVRNTEDLNSLQKIGRLNLNQVRDITALFRLSRRVRFANAELPQSQPHLNMVALKRSHFERNCSRECAICLESHIKGETIQTECGHKFGLKCWTEFLSTNTSVRTRRGDRHIRKKCPMCNKPNPKIIAFSMLGDGSPAWTSENLAEHKELFRRIFEEEQEDE